MADAGGRESVEMISEAMGLDGTVTKTGYMHKTAMSGSRSQWRKRYFVLNGHQLLYYADHKNLGTKSSNAKGDFLLTADCYIEDCAKIGSHEHVFEVHSGTHTLRMSARTADERAAWKAAIHAAISDVTDTTRGYLLVKVAGIFTKNYVRKYVVLHPASLTWHQAQKDTHRIQGQVKLSAHHAAELREDRTTLEIKLSGHAGAAENAFVLRCPDKVEAVKWLEAIEATIAKLGERDDLIAKQLGEGQNNNEQIMNDGYLATRPEGAKGAGAKGGSWPLKFYALTGTAL